MRTVKQNSQLTDYPRELRNVKTLKKIVKITKHIFWEDSRNYIKKLKALESNELDQEI